jgi:Na+-transporting methylmalonyl-CoA/oxaloacetate decarboxylase gamma subunit
MRPLKSLTLEAIVELLATTFGELEDPRAADQLTYPLHDTLLSGFALMFFQHPSLLQFQRAMQQKRRRCNLQTIFGVHEVPSDTQMREILEGVEPEPLRALLPQLCEKVRRAGWGSRFTTTLPSGQHQGTYYTVALDGSEYFHSTKVQCPHCLRQPDAKGQVHYSHLVVGATLVRAGSHQVVPVDAEEVRNPTAESHPQDCELTAGKRLIARLRREHPQMALIVIGDDLYSHVPFVEQLQHLRLHYVLVAKPDSHPTLMATVAAAEAHGVSQPGQWEEGSGTRRRIYTYRIVRQAPLAAENPVPVTFVEVWEHAAGGELLYHNSWITDLDVTAENVAAVVRIGRTRWKIENEQFNVQKNHGYELTHNYGHGQHGLSMVFYLLNLLAYVTHVIVELGDRLYQRCRARESRRELWAALRTMLHAVLVASWAQLLLVYLEEEATGP